MIRLQPEDAEAYCSRGKAYAEKGELEKAAADYTKAIALKQDFVEAYRGRAAVCEKKADLDGAIEDYLELIRLLPKAEADALQPKLVEIYKDRAKARAGAGDFDKAIADLSEVIRLRPDDVEARWDRARLYDDERQERSSHCRLYGSHPVGAEKGRLVPAPRHRACGERRAR